MCMVTIKTNIPDKILNFSITLGCASVICLLSVIMLGAVNLTLVPLTGFEDWGAKLLVYGFGWGSVSSALIMCITSLYMTWHYEEKCVDEEERIRKSERIKLITQITNCVVRSTSQNENCYCVSREWMERELEKNK